MKLEFMGGNVKFIDGNNRKLMLSVSKNYYPICVICLISKIRDISSSIRSFFTFGTKRIRFLFETS